MSNKKRIVIASTLKPADDIRSFRKIGVSLGKTNNYDVKILGAGGKVTSTFSNVTLMPFGAVARLSLRRILLPFIILRKVLSQKPHLLIIETHELLIPAVIIRLLQPRCKLVYDVRENYAANILSQQVFKGPVKFLLAGWVRFKERICMPFIRHLFIAEAGYLAEYPLLRRHAHTVLQNKSLTLEQRENQSKEQPINFIFTGNLSVNSGVEKAIECFKKLIGHYSEIKLLIVGHSPSAAFLRKLKKQISTTPQITLVGGNEPVDHSVIAAHISHADIGFVTYQVNDSNRNCMPTKVFEYLTVGLPIICEKGTAWFQLGNQNGMAFPLNEAMKNPKNLPVWYQSISYEYERTDFNWDAEEQKLIKSVDQLLHQ